MFLNELYFATFSLVRDCSVFFLLYFNEKEFNQSSIVENNFISVLQKFYHLILQNETH